MSTDISIVVGVCREDNPHDVDEAYGAGTYARLFPAIENETCSAVTRADYPTRQNDQTCTLRALATCANLGCEAPLCALHLDICRVCAQEFCEGCAEDHKRVHAG